MDDFLMEVSEHWKLYGVGGGAALAALWYRFGGNLKGLVSTGKAAMGGDNRADLAAALCLVSDHVHSLGDEAGIAACKTLAPLVMLATEPPEPAPTVKPVA